MMFMRMETTEKIVEAYCRYVRGWFTIPNVKCAGQHELDLLAIDVATDRHIKRYHIECGVSISAGYSKLTAKEFSLEKLKERISKAGQRRTIGYFIEHKFNPRGVVNELARYGFKGDNYTRVIVTWGWTDEAAKEAEHKGIELWDFREILDAIAGACHDSRSYYADDTLRTVQLLQRSGGRK
jgi:hypothetical protein